jgi:amidase
MHTIPNTAISHIFSAEAHPVLEIDPGQSVCFQTLDASNNTARTMEDALTKLTPPENANPVTGPVLIRGAEPGDTLAVRIDRIDLGPQGYSRITRSGGVIISELSPPAAKLPRVQGDTVLFDDRISFPIRPMVGTIGVAPSGDAISTFHPGDHGGNMDQNDVRIGSTVLLPIAVPGALLAIGDVHGSMGDGELTGGGFDIEAEVTVTVDVRKQDPWPRPRIETEEEWICCANARDLRDAIRIATSDMATFLSQRLGISREEAFILIGCRGDARIGQAAALDLDATARVAVPRMQVDSI